MKFFLFFLGITSILMHGAAAPRLSQEEIDEAAKRIVWRGPKPGKEFTRDVMCNADCCDLFCLNPGSNGKRARQFTRSHLKTDVLFLDGKSLAHSPYADVIYEAYANEHRIQFSQEGELSLLGINLCCATTATCLCSRSFFGSDGTYVACLLTYFCLNPIYNLTEISSQKMDVFFDDADKDR